MKLQMKLFDALNQQQAKQHIQQTLPYCVLLKLPRTDDIIETWSWCDENITMQLLKPTMSNMLYQINNHEHEQSVYDFWQLETDNNKEDLYGFYFKNKNDAMKFKLVFGDKIDYHS